MSVGGLTFGFIGVRYAFEALALNGQVEAALRTLLQTTYPSYGYELYNEYEPSSSLWESWDAPTHRQWLDESSRNHHYQVRAWVCCGEGERGRCGGFEVRPPSHNPPSAAGRRPPSKAPRGASPRQ
jgi:hypothetical protein